MIGVTPKTTDYNFNYHNTLSFPFKLASCILLLFSDDTSTILDFLYFDQNQTICREKGASELFFDSTDSGISVF